jgi:hypothetical protein
VAKTPFVAVMAAALGSAIAAPPISTPNAAGVPTQLVVTAIPERGGAVPENLGADDLAVTLNKAPARILRTERLAGNQANMQLFILLDDSLRASALGTQLPELKAFVASLPPTTEVAIGYMRNGIFSLTQSFTTDHAQAANALRLPMSIPGGNGSPYFVLSDLAKKWPSPQSNRAVTPRRVVLMLTDGVDRYYDNSEVDDPYVDESIHDALKQGLLVYSIYIRDTGLYDLGNRVTLFAQSRMTQVSEETGGYAYFQDFTNPVSVQPFLNDFSNRLEHQFEITVAAPSHKGFERAEVRSELPGLKIQGPTRVYVQ